jgi:hypothetical protein
MKGIFNIRIVLVLAFLIVVYLFVCDFDVPVINFGKKAESTAYVDSVKNMQYFEQYSYNQIYYHYVFENQRYIDSITSNRINGNVNRGDSLVILVSKMNPINHTVKSLHGTNKDYVQIMGW